VAALTETFCSTKPEVAVAVPSAVTSTSLVPAFTWPAPLMPASAWASVSAKATLVLTDSPVMLMPTPLVGCAVRASAVAV